MSTDEHGATAADGSETEPDSSPERASATDDEKILPAQGDPVTGKAERRRKKSTRKHLPIWQETLLLLGIALVLAVVIKALFVQAFYIPSESMEPGLVQNDRILVQKVSYWFSGSPERGDVVVFKDPDNWLGPNADTGPTNNLTKVMAKIGLYPTGGHLVKRVIGIEGDVIVCCDEQGRISVNGKPLEEKAYVNQGQDIQCNGPMTGNCKWEAGPVPKDHIFVMGDNRGASADSTVHLCGKNETDCTKNPFISDKLVVGKVFALVWPRDRFTWVKRPKSFEDIPAPK